MSEPHSLVHDVSDFLAELIIVLKCWKNVHPTLTVLKHSASAIGLIHAQA
jgi:hypothetical protein